MPLHSIRVVGSSAGGKAMGYCSLGKSGNLRDLLICPIAGATATSLIEGNPAWDRS